jgi:hypothetical protein
VVPGQQPLPQREQDEEADHGLQKKAAEQAPINIDWAEVERVSSFQFLGVHITNKLSWSKHIKAVMKRARQNLSPLRRLKRFGSPDPQKVLQLHHREHWLHHRLVWQLLGI